MLEDVQINAAVDVLLENAIASGPEWVDHSNRSIHQDRYNDWKKRKEEECRQLLQSARADFNIQRGLYGIKVDPRIRLEDIDSFHAEFIPAIHLKPRDLDKLGEQNGRRNKLYPDRTLMSARQYNRESYAALQKRLKKDFRKTAKDVLQGT